MLLRILQKYSNCTEGSKISNCTLEDRPQKVIWNKKLEKLFTETVEKELRSIKWEDFVKLQTNNLKSINFEIESLLSNVEDTFIKTAGKALRNKRSYGKQGQK